jgi:methylglutaconyl-CoA hydratase
MKQEINTEAFVNSSTENNITTIEFFHPQSNSLPGRILNALAEEIKKESAHNNSAVLVLKSAGNKSFCAGASFDELLQIKDEKTGLEFFSGFAKVINAMRTCPKFIVARIQGKCVGGGVGLAAAADYAIALNTAAVKLSELAVGIGPFVVGPAVERKMGLGAFSALSIDATNWRSAQWAYEKGLFAEIHETIEAVDAAVLKIAQTLSQSNPEAMADLKKVCWTGTENWDSLLMERAAISGRLILSDFSRQAIEKFKSK